tara:strand:- start:657 stop:1361 length:705 start_codon:yes stop_codon:yes gene_type:complete
MALFDVNNNIRKVTATANGSLTDFSFNFQVNNTTDLDVFLDGVLKSISSDYTVVTSAGSAGLNADGTGVVKFNSPPANTVIVSIKSDLPISRASVYTSGGNITAASLENDFDTITMQVGDIDESLSRSLKAPVNDPGSVNMTIPAKSARLGKALSFDSTTGDPTVSALTLTSVTVSTLSAGASATSSYNSTTGVLALGIPRGDTGASGPAGSDGSDGADGEVSAGFAIAMSIAL